MYRGRLALLSALGLVLASAGSALAAADSSSNETQPPPASPSWLDGIVFGGHVEFGATFNPTAPDGVSFGRLFTDKANQAVLNQFALSVARPTDPEAHGLDLGFRAEGMYGMDSQFTHFMGLGDQGTTSRNSFDVVEADVDLHLPVLHGVEVKAGLFPSPMGVEGVDPTGNPLYSRSYIYDFGLPKKHTGALATARLNEGLSLILGYTTGVNASLGPGGGYNDTQPHFLGGFGLDLGRVTLKALTHVGPEDPPNLLPAGVNPHKQWRYIGDVVLTWKVSDRLTSSSEFNFVRDDGLKARAGGVAEYVSFALSPRLAADLRAEVWRDAHGVFVAGYPGNLDYLNAEEGRPNGSYRFGPATYGEVTAGLTIKTDALRRILPTDSPFGALSLRPELRYDQVLAGDAPFGGRRGGSRKEFTAGLDIVVPLSFQRSPAGGRDSLAGEGVADDDASVAAATSALTDERTGAGNADTPSQIAVPQWALAQQPALGLAYLDDLSGFAPGLLFLRSGSAVPMPTIRGLADAGPSAGLVPGMGVRLDGVALEAELTGIVDLLDVSKVEIDPRLGGADYGDTALDGTLALQRPKPTRRWGVLLDYGFEQGYHANIEKALLNAPLGDDAGLSLFVSHRQRGGYLTNIYTGEPLYGRDELTDGALQFAWSVTPRLDVDLGVTLAHQDGQGAPLSLGDVLDARLSGPALAANQGLAFNAYGSPYLPGVTKPLGPFQSSNDFGDISKLTAQIYSLSISYDLPGGRLTSTTAYQTLDSVTGQDLDGGCVPADSGPAPCPTLTNPFVGFLHGARTQTSDRFSQDLTLTYRLGDLITARAGLAYARDRLSAQQNTRSATLTDQSWDQTREARSVFAGLTIDPSPRLRFDGALRYLSETTDFRQQVSQGVPLTASAGSERTTKVLPRAEIDYRLNDGLTVYATYAGGLRPGGEATAATLSEQIPGQPNYDPANPRANYSAYAAETDETYEIGSKAQALGGRISAEVTAFLSEDHNRQALQLVLTPGYAPAVNTYVVNLPKVEIKGVEFQLEFRPRHIAGLTLSGEGAYQDARIVDGRVPATEVAVNAAATAGAPGAVFDLTGAPVLLTPRFTYAVRADYHRPLGGGVVEADAGYRWSDRFALATLAGQGDYQPAYGLLDASLSYARSFYRISVSGKNLLNRAYLTSALPALFVHAWGDPRTAVVELQVRF
jgi:outer membrane receptor protein involved in Fe transport